jgi:hypothetical protein
MMEDNQGHVEFRTTKGQYLRVSPDGHWLLLFDRDEATAVVRTSTPTLSQGYTWLVVQV